MDILLNFASSLNGYLSAQGKRILLSNEDDLRIVHGLRAKFDAIMVGANTVRVDNPRLLSVNLPLTSPQQPLRVIVTHSGNIPSSSQILYPPGKTLILTDNPNLKHNLKASQIVIIHELKSLTPETIISYLESIGIGSVLVEGGGKLLTAFIKSSLPLRIRAFFSPILIDPLQGVPWGGQFESLRVKEVNQVGNGIEIIAVKT